MVLLLHFYQETAKGSVNFFWVQHKRQVPAKGFRYQVVQSLLYGQTGKIPQNTEVGTQQTPGKYLFETWLETSQTVFDVTRQLCVQFMERY